MDMLFWRCQIPFEGLCCNLKVWNLASFKVGNPPHIPNYDFIIFLSSYGTQTPMKIPGLFPKSNCLFSLHPSNENLKSAIANNRKIYSMIQEKNLDHAKSSSRSKYIINSKRNKRREDYESTSFINP